MIHYYVADSQIHGKGLFARKYIGAGELVGVLDDVCYADECHIIIPD